MPCKPGVGSNLSRMLKECFSRASGLKHLRKKALKRGLKPPPPEKQGFFSGLLGLISFPKLQNSCRALSFPGVGAAGVSSGTPVSPWQAKKMLG